MIVYRLYIAYHYNHCPVKSQVSSYFEVENEYGIGGIHGLSVMKFVEVKSKMEIIFHVPKLPNIDNQLTGFVLHLILCLRIKI